MTPLSTLHRTGPATRWLEALPLGNGRIGAMVWGDPQRARFDLNESTLWSGSPTATQAWHTSREEAGRIRTRSRELFEDGRSGEAQDEIEKLGAAWSQAYQPVGSLVIAGGDTDETAARTLDLQRAEHLVQATGGAHRTFVSAADEVLVHSLPCPAGSSPSLEFTSPLVEEQREESAGALTVTLRAPSDVPPERFRDLAEITWEPDGAARAVVVVRTRREGERMLVVCAIATTWQGLGAAPDREVADARADATAQAEAALALGEVELHRRHLGHPLPGLQDVALHLQGSESAELLATTFAYGRHLLASSSRPGLPPANLQGLWNTQVLSPWSSNYTVNINLEMNHWAAGVAHVPDAGAALEAYVAMLRQAGRDTARRIYGADGWAVHHNSDPWGYTDPVRGNPKWSTWPMGGLWLEQELDSIASFSGEDPAVIARRRFSARREAAAFAMDMLHGSADGHLVTFPSTSPENEWITPKGRAVGLSEGTAMDRWLVRGALGALLDAAELLGRQQDPVVRRAAESLTLIPGPSIGADGRILEWHTDGLEEIEPAHRHVSHLGFEYPGTGQIEPELSRAAAASLEARGDEATGWSLAWKTCLWARLHRPDRVQTLLEMFLRPAETEDGTERAGLYPNLFSAHPPFQIDGNIGIVAALAECLVQSHRGEIELLPALPPIMAEGSLRGIRARPGIEIEMSWADSRLTALSLRALGPGAVGTHRVRCGGQEIEVDLPGNGIVQVDVGALAAATPSSADAAGQGDPLH